MAKTEKIFPINTVGGKIQHLRLKMGLSRIQLYDKMYPDSEITYDSKNKTIYNWESETTKSIQHKDFSRLCKVLKCSSDYLLGLDECTSKTNQFISDETGLSDKSIQKLKIEKQKYDHNKQLADKASANALAKLHHTYGLDDDSIQDLKEKMDISVPLRIDDEMNLRMLLGQSICNQYFDQYFSIYNFLIENDYGSQIVDAIERYSNQKYSLGDDEIPSDIQLDNKTSVADYIYGVAMQNLADKIKKDPSIYKEYIEEKEQIFFDEIHRLKQEAEEEIRLHANKSELIIDDDNVL